MAISDHTTKGGRVLFYHSGTKWSITKNRENFLSQSAIGIIFFCVIIGCEK